MTTLLLKTKLLKTKLLTAGGAAALVLAGAGVEWRMERRGDGEAGAPFINPALSAQGICGGGDKIAARRAYFVGAARAFAAAAQDDAQTPGDSAPKAQEFAGIGYDITTASPAAQTLFNRGLGFLWGFNHAEAINQFKAAQAEDPDCAMCYWGEAYALGPNINAPMDPDANAPAWGAFQKARAASEGASEKERTLINALADRYAEEPPEERSRLNEAFAERMGEIAARYPDDDFIGVVAAEANMDMHALAWDFWETDGRTPRERTAETIALLERVLENNPNHPGAIHFYIHATEASNDPYRATSYADKLGGLAPDLGHLVHMPSHNYYRIGEFKKSLAANIDAVAADEAYIAAADASLLYEFGYYTHNIHFAMTSAQMAGDRKTALAMAEKLDAKLPMEMVAAAAWVQPIKAAPFYAMAQFNEFEKILEAEDPGPDAAFLQGAWRYARGEAFARSGNLEEARAEAAAIGEIIDGADLSELTDADVPALDILAIARNLVLARAAMAEDAHEAAIFALEEAAAIQDQIDYMEPPYWYYPVKQTLGAALIRAGEHERAEQVFIEALGDNPNNAWVLYGLAESYGAQNDGDAEEFATALFRKAWAGEDGDIALDRL